MLSSMGPLCRLACSAALSWARCALKKTKLQKPVFPQGTRVSHTSSHICCELQKFSPRWHCHNFYSNSGKPGRKKRNIKKRNIVGSGIKIKFWIAPIRKTDFFPFFVALVFLCVPAYLQLASEDWTDLMERHWGKMIGQLWNSHDIWPPNLPGRLTGCRHSPLLPRLQKKQKNERSARLLS